MRLGRGIGSEAWAEEGEGRRQGLSPHTHPKPPQSKASAATSGTYSCENTQSAAAFPSLGPQHKVWWMRVHGSSSMHGRNDPATAVTENLSTSNRRDQQKSRPRLTRAEGQVWCCSRCCCYDPRQCLLVPQRIRNDSVLTLTYLDMLRATPGDVMMMMMMVGVPFCCPSWP